jgi:hypothetical protein
MTVSATYVYCVIAAARRPQVRRGRAGLPGTGPVRLLELASRLEPRGGAARRRRPAVARHGKQTLYVAVADAPLKRYGEAAINRGLSDLDWVSRAAVAHEAVVESFIDAPAVLPMKLFTIFTSDERALAHVRLERHRIAALVKRVADQHEWGLRVVFDPARVAAVPRDTKRVTRGRRSGAAYLSRKKAHRDASIELTARARETVAALYDRLAARARLAKRRTASELPVQGGPLLLDAAFLVGRSKERSFRAAVLRDARALAKHGYGLTLSGPWPPYSFVQD